MLKRMEDEGFQFEGAEASFELLMERALGNHKTYFELDGFRVIVEEDKGNADPLAEATVRLKVKGIADSPAASVRPDGSYSVEAVTATASFRFGKSMTTWFERSGAKVIVGKAGLTELAYREWFVPHGAVYLTTVGYGLGAMYGRTIKRVLDVHWLKELGIAQALWVLEVERIGPFLVEGDAAGRSLFALANREVNLRIDEVYKTLPPPALSRFGEVLSRKDEVV
ncbi:MAG: fumarate hydratase [Candidatus Rokuibacteriota bacterium]|nr:MAG: fumarate hydratase [Candidatus Rokubacteria bacterium]